MEHADIVLLVILNYANQTIVSKYCRSARNTVTVDDISPTDSSAVRP